MSSKPKSKIIKDSVQRFAKKSIGITTKDVDNCHIIQDLLKKYKKHYDGDDHKIVKKKIISCTLYYNNLTVIKINSIKKILKKNKVKIKTTVKVYKNKLN